MNIREELDYKKTVNGLIDQITDLKGERDRYKAALLSEDKQQYGTSEIERPRHSSLELQTFRNTFESRIVDLRARLCAVEGERDRYKAGLEKIAVDGEKYEIWKSASVYAKAVLRGELDPLEKAPTVG